MAKLPYTYTICPDQEAPKTFTASCREMGALLKDSVGGDLTIDQRRHGAWGSWTNRPLRHKPLEERLSDMLRENQTKKEKANEPTTQT